VRRCITGDGGILKIGAENIVVGIDEIAFAARLRARSGNFVALDDAPSTAEPTY
jgi:hypothetical protein